MQTLYVRACRSSLIGFSIMVVIILLPARTLNYWQAWLFMSVFVTASGAVTVYLAIHDPTLLDRRMRAGPLAEKAWSQKFIISLAMTGFIGLLVISAFDHRFAWSPVPTCVCLIGDTLIAVGFLLVFFVIRVNTYAASTIQVTEDQKVISTGPYGVVRHPMYAGSLPILIGTPLALGSWSGLAALVVFVPALVWRLMDEESFLRKNLPGYTEYTDKVRYRLVPHVW